jgi:hypothetical protein
MILLKKFHKTVDHMINLFINEYLVKLQIQLSLPALPIRPYMFYVYITSCTENFEFSQQLKHIQLFAWFLFIKLS